MNQKIVILCQERDKMRDESIALGKRIHNTIIVFFTIAIAILSLTFKGIDIISKDYLEVVVFSLSQIEFVLIILGLTIISNQHVHAEYLQAIETKINTELKSKLLVWENHITSKFLRSRNSSFHWGALLYSLALVLIFIYIMYLTIFLFENNYMSAVLALELIASILLVKKQSSEQKRCYEYTLEKIEF